MSPGTRLECVFCLGGEHLEVRADRHGRPYLQCGQCMTRVFIHGCGWNGPQKLFGKLRLAADQPNAIAVAAELIEREKARDKSNG